MLPKSTSTQVDRGRYHQTYGRDGRTIHLPLVDRVEAFQTHIYPLYVQFATKMIRVDGVGVFWGGGGTARSTTWQIACNLMIHTSCAIDDKNDSIQKLHPICTFKS